jgi:hypothetical protein
MDVQTGEFTRYRNSLLDEQASLKVLVWDVGPEKPHRPAKPVVSKEARPGSVEYDIEQIELRSVVENYEKILGAYLASLRDFESWHQRHSGPILLTQWTCDARDTFRHDSRAVAEGRQNKRRYYRYDPKAARLGLPVGIEPGRSHAEQIARQADDAAALALAKAADPVFGGLEP